MIRMKIEFRKNKFQVEWAESFFLFDRVETSIDEENWIYEVYLIKSYFKQNFAKFHWANNKNCQILCN